MAESRQRIIEQLKRLGGASVSDLGSALGLTSVTVRHHLQSLLRDHVVDEPTPRRRPGPGRPEKVYRLIPQAEVDLPDNFGELCACLVGQIQTGQSYEALRDVLSAAGERLGRAQSPASGVSSKVRTEAVKAFLEWRGYFPSWIRATDGLRLQLANCPYHKLASQTPAVCSFDTALLSGLLGMEVKLESSIAALQPVCTFRVTAERGFDSHPDA